MRSSTSKVQERSSCFALEAQVREALPHVFVIRGAGHCKLVSSLPSCNRRRPATFSAYLNGCPWLFLEKSSFFALEADAHEAVPSAFVMRGAGQWQLVAPRPHSFRRIGDILPNQPDKCFSKQHCSLCQTGCSASRVVPAGAVLLRSTPQATATSQHHLPERRTRCCECQRHRTSWTRMSRP
jgi:hypothetical protein